jgi:hypothetical protein
MVEPVTNTSQHLHSQQTPEQVHNQDQQQQQQQLDSLTWDVQCSACQEHDADAIAELYWWPASRHSSAAHQIIRYSNMSRTCQALRLLIVQLLIELCLCGAAVLPAAGTVPEGLWLDANGLMLHQPNPAKASFKGSGCGCTVATSCFDAFLPIMPAVAVSFSNVEPPCQQLLVCTRRTLTGGLMK